MVFDEELWFSIGLHLDMGRGWKKSSDWAEIFTGDTYHYISEVLLSVFKNFASFFFYKENTKRFSREPSF